MNKICKILIALGWIVNTAYGAANGVLQGARDVEAVVQQTLQEVNGTTFAERSLHLEVLKNCPETIPVLAEWIYEDWHPYDSSLTKEKMVNGFRHRLNGDKLPLTFVALEGSRPVGVISLKNQAGSELSDLDDGSAWGGGFHIIPEKRNQGLGEEMAKFLITLARELGYQKLRFYTSDPKSAKWYIHRGAQVLETRAFRGHVITIMEYRYLAS